MAPVALSSLPPQAHAHACSPRLPGPWADLWPPVSLSLSAYPTLAMLCGCCWPLERPDLIRVVSSSLGPYPPAQGMSGQLPSPRLCSPNAKTPSMRSRWATCRAGCGSWPGVQPGASSPWGRVTAGSTAARPRNPGVGQLLAVGRRREAAQAWVSLCPGVGSTPACAVPAPAVPTGPHPSGSSRCGCSPLWWPPAQIDQKKLKL